MWSRSDRQELRPDERVSAIVDIVGEIGYNTGSDSNSSRIGRKLWGIGRFHTAAELLSLFLLFHAVITEVFISIRYG